MIGTEVDEQGEVFFASRSELIEELKAREQQVLQLAQTAAKWEDEKKTLEQAEALLGYKEANDIEILATKVLARTRTFSEEELLIDIGASDGVHINDPVISGDGIFVGTIEEVFNSTSRVALLTNTKSVVGATLLDLDGTSGIVSGGNGPLVKMGFVPRDTDVKVNDLIMTSGVDPNVPRGLVIGIVNTIEEDTNAPFLHLFIEPLADIRHLRMLGVLKISQL